MENFRAVFSFDGDIFFKTLENTAVFIMGIIPLTMVISLGLALLANQHLPMLGFYKSALFMPMVTSFVAIPKTYILTRGGPMYSTYTLSTKILNDGNITKAECDNLLTYGGQCEVPGMVSVKIIKTEGKYRLLVDAELKDYLEEIRSVKIIAKGLKKVESLI